MPMPDLNMGYGTNNTNLLIDTTPVSHLRLNTFLANCIYLAANSDGYSRVLFVLSFVTCED